MIQNEVAILRRVKHPNIVLLIEEVDTYNELYLVMELVKVCLPTKICYIPSILIDTLHYEWAVTVILSLSAAGKCKNSGRVGGASSKLCSK